jgi:hypothetical protein
VVLDTAAVGEPHDAVPGSGQLVAITVDVVTHVEGDWLTSTAEVVGHTELEKETSVTVCSDCELHVRDPETDSVMVRVVGLAL